MIAKGASKRTKNLVKNPGPEDQALISPRRGGVYPHAPNGIMEWWKNGILFEDDVLILFSDSCHLLKTDLIPLDPLFQYSSVPIALGFVFGSAG